MGQPRALPDAAILGAMKSGTSSLHHYLVQQPGVIEPLRKEVHYFDVNLDRGEAWYRAHFGRVARRASISTAARITCSTPPCRTGCRHLCRRQS